MIEDRINLGKTNLSITPMGLGIMQWGAIKISDQPDGNSDRDIHGAFQAALEAGINFFDTAEMYGSGRSESYLGRYLKEVPNNIVVATKFMPFPWRLSKGELRSALVRSLERLGLDHVDLYQMHWPIPPIRINTWMDEMADVYTEGLIRAVGVSNYFPSQTRTAFEALAKRNIPLASNQVKYNLLHRSPERGGLTDLCRELGVTIIAYSPLERGILTGKYSQDNLPKGRLAWRYNRAFLIKIEPLFAALHEIGKAHGGKSPAQIALNWLMCKGTVPIPGARNQQQAQENSGAMGWQLSAEEVERLDKISNEVS